MSPEKLAIWKVRWPLYLLVAAVAGLVVGSLWLVDAEQVRAEGRARQVLRQRLTLAAGRLGAQGQVLAARARAAEDSWLVSARGRFLQPPEPRALTPLPAPVGSDPRGRFFLQLGDSQEARGQLDEARSAWQVAAGPEHGQRCRAQACFRLAALAARSGEQDQARRWRASLLALLPDLGPAAPLSTEALLQRVQAGEPDEHLASDLALLLEGPDDTLARGLLRQCGLLRADAVVRRRRVLALMHDLRPLLPSAQDPERGLHASVDRIVVWQRRSDGTLQIAHASPAQLADQVRLVDGSTPLLPATSPWLEERAPAGLPGLQLAATSSRAAFREEARRRAALLVAGLVVLVAGAGAAGWLSLRAWRRELAAARARSAFVARVGHDLRTPLTSIRLYAETLAQGRVDSLEESRAFAGTVAREAERLTTLVDRVLDLSRLDAAPTLEQVPVEMTALVSEVLDSFQPLAAEAGVLLALDGAGEQICVPGDPAALRGMVANLLDNALVHASGSERVDVQLAACADELTLRVQDRGPGLPEGMGTRLFERFVRGPLVRARGAGLGLAVVREVAEAHGGRADASNRKGGGACFSVTLPRSS